MKPKFKIGEKVKFINDNDFGEVLSYSFDGKDFTYKISAKEVDFEAKTVVKGLKTCKENELVGMEGKNV